MKYKILSVIMAAIMAVSSVGCMSPRNFSDLSNVNGVSMVYTSAALLKIATGSIGHVTGVNLNKVIDHMGSVRVIVADNPSAIKKAQSVVRHQIGQIHAEPLFEVVGGNINTNNKNNGIYVTASGPDTFSNVVVVSSFGTKYQAIFLDGSFTVADIQSLGL